MPKVMIGVPVYNGASMLRETLECLRSQTYRDFGVLICDNASTDGSTEIAQEFAKVDARFTVLTSPTTISAWDNFQRALEFSQSPYFAWRAYDDLSALNFIEVLAECLDADLKADLAACDVRTLKMHSGREKLTRVPQLSGWGLRAKLQLLKYCHASWLYGLWRRSALVPLLELGAREYRHEWAGDHAMLYPLHVGQRVALSGDTWFLQRTGMAGKRGRSNEALAGNERRVYLDYIAFCNARLNEAGLFWGEKLLLKAHLPLDAHRRTYRVGRLVRRAVTG